VNTHLVTRRVARSQRFFAGLLALSFVSASAGCGGGGATQSVNSRLQDDVEFDDEGAERHPASERVQAGEAKLVAGDLAGARADFEAAIADDPSDARAHLDLGLVLELGEDFEGAERAYRETLALDADFPEALNNLGLLLRDSERAEEAASLLRRAVELRPSYAEATLNLGLALEDLGDHAGALDAYRRAARLSPDDAYPRVSLGLLLAETGDATNARTELQRARSLAQGDAGTLLEIGSALRQLSDFEGAERAITDAIAANDDTLTPTLAAELALAKLGRSDNAGARATLEQAITQHPDDATLHFLLGRVAVARDDVPAARVAFTRMLELEADSERATSVRTWLAEHPEPQAPRPSGRRPSR
jgi:Flp pilus assembly protein TadD